MVLQGLAAAGGVVLVVAVLLLWVETPTELPRRRKRRAPAGGELVGLGAALWTGAKTVAVAMLAVAVLCIAALLLLSHGSVPPQTLTNAFPPPRVGPRPSEGLMSAHSVNLRWLLLPIAVTFAILTPLAALIRRWRLKRGQAATAEEAGAIGQAVRASIAALESEPDPRTAILRAYARMEQAFRNVEIVRARDETASEFLGRTTRGLPVSADAAAALTERFEEVRYSTHQITEAEREQALSSLHRVERELGERP
jgi:MFS family permease